MRTLFATLAVAATLGILGLTPTVARGQDYDGCSEQFYDSKDEPCGGGHQHSSGKRDEHSLEIARHRHRYLEDQLQQLSAKVAALSAEVEQLKKAGAK